MKYPTIIIVPLERNSHPICLSIAINIFFLASCLIMGNLHFGALDDYFMAAVLSGAFGNDYNPHLYFINALYGYALLPLYNLFPKIGWYYIGEIAGVFLSYTIVSYIIILKMGKYWGTLLSSLLLLFTCQHFYLSVQFTQCAAIFAAAGIATTLWAISENKRKAIILGVFLIFWGALMRKEAFLMGMPFLIATMLIQFRDCLKNLKATAIITVILASCICGAYFFDNLLYKNEPYKTYKEFQGPRAVFGDAHNFDFEEIYKDLEKNGKSIEDYKMLCQWKFYDTEVFATDSLLDFLKYVNPHKNKLNRKSPIQILSNLNRSINDYTCWAFFIFGIVILATNPKRGLYPWLALLITLGLITYLQYLQRVVLRVENGFWIYAAILAIPHFRYPTTTFTLRKNTLTIVICTTSIIVSLFHLYSLSQIQTDRKNQDVYDKVFEYIENRPNTMFLFSMPQFEQLPEYKNPPYLAEPIGCFKRMVSIGYWTAYLPDVTESLKEFHITNPIKEVVNDNVIMVGDGFLGDYLERHYYDSVSVNMINQIGPVKFYKYSAMEKK